MKNTYLIQIIEVWATRIGCSKETMEHCLSTVGESYARVEMYYYLNKDFLDFKYGQTQRQESIAS